MEPFLFTFPFMLMGMGLRRLPQFPKEAFQVLNLFVIYIALPALILFKAPQIRFSQDILLPVIMSCLMLLFSAAFVLLAGRFMRWPGPEKPLAPFFSWRLWETLLFGSM